MKFKIIFDNASLGVSKFIISGPTTVNGYYPSNYREAHGYGLVGTGNAMGCCGLALLERFSYMTTSFIRDGELDKWETKASFLSELYKHLYHTGYVMYALAPAQEQTNPAHKWFLELGARRMMEFPNIFHGPNIMGVWLVNIRNAAGRVCDKYGEMYLEPPKDEPPAISNPTEKAPYDYARLPVKGVD